MEEVVTKKLFNRVKSIARKLVRNETDYDDCVGEGIDRICTMMRGHTESFYAQHAYRRMQNYLRKERKYYKRHKPLKEEA